MFEFWPEARTHVKCYRLINIYSVELSW